MNTGFKPPGKHAGKTVKPREAPVLSSDSDDDPVFSDQGKHSGSEEPEVEAKPQSSQSIFVAAPPALSQRELLPPEQVNVQEVRKYINPDLASVHVRELRWDTTQSWGQIRTLNDEMVQYYSRELERDPPRQCIRVLLRDMGSGLIKKFNPNRSNFFSPCRQ